MMKILKFGKSMIFMMGILVSVSWAADGGWKKIGESKGIAGYPRPTSRSSVDEIRAVGIVDAPISVVEAVIRDISVMPQYIFLCKEAYLIDTPDMRSRGDVMYFYSLTGLPFPVSNRDSVTRAVWSIDKKTGIIHCHAEGIRTIYQQKKDVVRMSLSIIDCTLIPQGKDKTEVFYQVLADPGGELPPFLVSMLTRDYGIKTIAGLRQMVKKDKYKNAGTVVTATVKSNPR